MALPILDKGQAYIDGCLIRIFWHLLCRPSFLRYLLTELRKSLIVLLARGWLRKQRPDRPFRRGEPY